MLTSQEEMEHQNLRMHRAESPAPNQQSKTKVTFAGSITRKSDENNSTDDELDHFDFNPKLQDLGDKTTVKPE